MLTFAVGRARKRVKKIGVSPCQHTLLCMALVETIVSCAAPERIALRIAAKILLCSVAKQKIEAESLALAQRPNYKTKNPIKNDRVLWYLQESNQGHMDFQSIALPTELRYRA